MFEFQNFENASFYFEELWDIDMLMRFTMFYIKKIHKIHFKL